MGDSRQFKTAGGACKCQFPRFIFEKEHKFMFTLKNKTHQQSRGVKMRCLLCGGFRWWKYNDPRLENLKKDISIELINESMVECLDDKDAFLNLVGKELKEIKQIVFKY